MIKIKNESDNYTDFDSLEQGDVFYWNKYDGYFMKIESIGFVTSTTTTPTLNESNIRRNAVCLDDGHLYLVNEDAEIIKAHSAKLTVDM